MIAAQLEVRIHCAKCADYDLCVPCFSNGSTSRDHDPATHGYLVIEQHSIPIFKEDWGADEELALLTGAETYGLGSWAEIADHIGGYRTKDEVRDHYLDTYVYSSKFPLPERANPKDKALMQQIPRDEFQARKKRRIEERKEAAKNIPLASLKQKVMQSTPSCHEVQGYMPGRLEFETEYANEAEEAVQHMQFDPGDGINPNTGQLEPDVDLKLTVMDIYNTRLTQRAERKRIIFEHNILDYRKNAAADKKRTKEERDLHNKTKPFARLMNHKSYTDFYKGLDYELHLRQAIAQLQEWREMSIGDLESGQKYEQEKLLRNQQKPPAGPYNHNGTVGKAKASQAAEPPPGPSIYNMSEVHADLKKPQAASTLSTRASNDKPITNGNTNGTLTPQYLKAHYTVQPLSTVSPIKLNNDTTDLHLLLSEEQKLCETINILPKPYLAIKQHLLIEAAKHGGILKRKIAKDICKIDGAKAGRIFDFMVHAGWINKQ
ncbi:MAG: Transcriptional adapter ada2 [Cirrosporium novae-zelandiae]|nr:MAG: Transcriptional adapter ada2 [Cirrosporium novae-zelandiae]